MPNATVLSYLPPARLKLPLGVQILPNIASSSGPSFYDSTSVLPLSTYSQLGASLPTLEGDLIASYCFVVFRPDGSMDAPSSNPFLEFKRLRAGAVGTEYALVLSPETGRARVVPASCPRRARVVNSQPVP